MSKILFKSLKTFQPPPDLNISEWADTYRQLSRESSAEAGQWDTDRAPYQREIMDTVLDPIFHTTVWVSGTQLGKTEVLNNTIGYFSHQDPCPMLLIQPTTDMARVYSTDRLAPMIRDTPVLKRIYSSAKSKTKSNTLAHKEFPGGFVALTGANSAAGLASRPVRGVLLDELDRYPASAGTEGDAVELATARQENFWNSFNLQVSSPTNEGTSRIWKSFLLSDQRYFHLPCPDCGAFHQLLFKNMFWEKGEDGKALIPGETWMCCPECGTKIDEKHKYSMLAKGKWIKTAKYNGTAGFHISRLYSPFSKWSKIRDKFLRCKDSPELLKVFTNTALAELWKKDREKVSWAKLSERRMNYTKLPVDALCLTMAVDVQDDRLEMEIIAWGEGLQSWGVKYIVLQGDPGKELIWQKLEEVMELQFEREDGVMLHIPAVGIDTGGHHATEVYDFCRKHKRLAHALKGRGGEGLPIIGRPSKNNKGKVLLYIVGVDSCKTKIFSSMLKTTKLGPGYCHFPADPEAGYDDGWFKMLCNESPETFYKSGVAYTRWVAHGRNEALDCRVYNIATLSILNPNFKRIRENQEPQEKEEKKKVAITQKTRPKYQRPSKQNFVNSWKK